MKQLCMMLAMVAAVASVPRPAAAEEAWRIALLVANNRGNDGRPPLHYAEQDATELAAVLVQLGGFRADDVHVLRSRALADVRATIAQIKQSLAAGRATGRRVVLLFYFSGHSDGQALELGTDRWAFADVRRELQELGAEIRIAIIDSCKSGALLTEKGGRPGPTFDIRFTDDLATSGEAILTSSAAHEMALESREIRASFFSHHFVSGLRGAADASGDGRVTLGEAYRYAFVNTLLATSNTLSGPQHPGYDYRLSGQGELVLTDVSTRGAKLSLPRAFDRILIADEGRRHLVAELTNLSARRIALPAGRYLVQGRKEGHAREVAVELKEGESREIAAAELAPTNGADAIAKGGDDDFIDVEQQGHAGSPAPELAFGAGFGITRGAADALPWVGEVRLEASLGRQSGWLFRLDLASGSATGFRETGAYGEVGYFVGRQRGRLAGRAGWQVTSGPIMQAVDGGARFWTTVVGTGPWVDGSIEIVPRLAVGVSAGFEGVLLRRDGAVTPTLWPAVGATLQLRM